MNPAAWPWATPEPGIYFAMPFDQYLAIPCLNNGGVKNLLISEFEFWCHSWMNPIRGEFDRDTDERRIGRAYHKRLLEGDDAYYSLYSPEFEYDKSDTSIITTSAQIAGELAKRGQKTTFALKKQGIERLLAVDPMVKILEIMEAEHREIYGNTKEQLPGKTWRRVDLAAARIRSDEYLRPLLLGGYPEVTVIFDDPELGVRFKVRYDFLKITAIVDLKTFANKKRAPIGEAVEEAIGFNDYMTQAWLYLRSLKFARDFVRRGMVYGGSSIPSMEWLNDFAASTAEDFWFLFMQKDGAPDAVARQWSGQDQDMRIEGEDMFREATSLFKKCHNKYGEKLWPSINPPSHITLKNLPRRYRNARV